MSQSLKSIRSSQDIIKERYKDTITSFLKDNSLYDCLSINNQVTVIDQSFSCYDVLRIFIQSSIDEAVFWNSDIQNYDGMFTFTDLIKVLLRFYKRLFEQDNQQYNNNNKIEEENNRIEEELKQNHSFHPPNGLRLTKQQKEQIIYDLKNVSIHHWFTTCEAENIPPLIKGRIDEKLHESCRKLIQSNVHRIIVVDTETKMIVGSIQQKDVLVFLIKGFTQYFNDLLASNPHQKVEGSQQHKLEIGYFFQPLDLSTSIKFEQLPKKKLVIMINSSMTVYQRTSIPVVNDEGKYRGTIHRRDFIFILEENNFDLLALSVEQFLHYLIEQKKKRNIYSLFTKEEFSMNQTVKEVVENLVLSESCFLVCLYPDKTIQDQLSIQDIFNFFIGDE